MAVQNKIIGIFLMSMLGMCSLVAMQDVKEPPTERTREEWYAGMIAAAIRLESQETSRSSQKSPFGFVGSYARTDRFDSTGPRLSETDGVPLQRPERFLSETV